MAGPDPAAAGGAVRRRGDGNGLGVGAGAFRGRVVCASGFSNQQKVSPSAQNGAATPPPKAVS